jgi:CheY-like chemotaxis protein
LQIAVRDSGVGIPLSKLRSIFETFTQADNSISRRYGGTGLGLSICRSLVELHGGRIDVESLLGTGSTFRVWLPLGSAPEEGGTAFAGKASTDVVPSQGVHVLVVEDTPVTQKVILAILVRNGYAADVAPNGLEAIRALEERRYDIVLMDVQMPVLDGLETTRAIRRNPAWRNMPIVAMTAHAMNGDRERCLEAGMDAYLAKPVDAAQLLFSIRDTLSSRLVNALPDPPLASEAALDSTLVELARRISRVASNNSRSQS